MFKRVVFVFCLATTKGVVASTIAEDANLTCPNVYYEPEVQESPLVTMSFGFYHLISAIPFMTGVLSHVALVQRFPKENPVAHEFVNRVMTPINAALALPVVGPISSKMQQYWFSLLQAFRREGDEKASIELETRWHDTQAAYGPNAQNMRAVYASVTGRVSTNANRAKNAVASGDDKYAVEQIAEAAVSMRFLFAEIKPSDGLVSMTVHVQFTNHVKLDSGFAQRVLEVISLYDNQYNICNATKKYYQELLDVWLR